MSNVLLTSKGSFAEVVKTEAELIEQLPALLPNAVIPVEGTPMTIAQVLDQLRGHSTTIVDFQASRVTTKLLSVKQKSERVGVQVTVKAIQAYVAGALGTASSVYATLGFAPAKRAVPSAAVKAVAEVKRQATRIKRHIMGKNQRAAIPPATAPVTTPTAPTTQK